MLFFDFYEFMRDTKKVFNAALTDEVIVTNQDGNSYKILPIKMRINQKNRLLKIFRT
jgi:histidinol phosphatase-like enzyme